MTRADPGRPRRKNCSRLLFFWHTTARWVNRNGRYMNITNPGLSINQINILTQLLLGLPINRASTNIFNTFNTTQYNPTYPTTIQLQHVVSNLHLSPAGRRIVG